MLDGEEEEEEGKEKEEERFKEEESEELRDDHPDTDSELDEFFDAEEEITDQKFKPSKSFLQDLLLQDEPIYPGSLISLKDAICTLFIYFLTIHTDKNQFQKMLDLLHLFLPANLIPKRVEEFLKLFAASDGRIRSIDFCENVFSPI